MKNTVEPLAELATSIVISPEAFYEHWQGHRRLTRRVIDAFPEDKLFKYSIGGMRPFGEMVLELIDLAGAGVKGVATGKWENSESLLHFSPANTPDTKEELLELWDNVTATMQAYWPQIAPQRFQETDKAFGEYEGTVYSTLLYFVDNEIHHRAQAYVYLRSLGIEPPPFWDRN
ncbi:MAG: DinB family protein [Chitinophagaceae bacterium]